MRSIHLDAQRKVYPAKPMVSNLIPVSFGFGSVSEKHGLRAVSELEAIELQELDESVAASLISRTSVMLR